MTTNTNKDGEEEEKNISNLKNIFYFSKNCVSENFSLL